MTYIPSPKTKSGRSLQSRLKKLGPEKKIYEKNFMETKGFTQNNKIS